MGQIVQASGPVTIRGERFLLGHFVPLRPGEPFLRSWARCGSEGTSSRPRHAEGLNFLMLEGPTADSKASGIAECGSDCQPGPVVPGVALAHKATWSEMSSDACAVDGQLREHPLSPIVQAQSPPHLGCMSPLGRRPRGPSSRYVGVHTSGPASWDRLPHDFSPSPASEGAHI